MSYLAAMYAMITCALKTPLNIYGFTFSYWDIMVFIVFVPFIIKFLVHVMFLADEVWIDD